MFQKISLEKQTSSDHPRCSSWQSRKSFEEVQELVKMKILVVLSFVVLMLGIEAYAKKEARGKGREHASAKKEARGKGREHVIGDPNQCVFPFTYDGKTYNKCTYASHNRPWCAYDHEYQRGRWDNCECSEEDRRECAAIGDLCLPAGDDKPQKCIPFNTDIGRR
ncbi:uncharacterized protein LOC144629866 isoform X2 [Oculina patagonica]